MQMIENADTFMTDQPTKQPKDRHERLQITPWLNHHKNPDKLTFLLPLSSWSSPIEAIYFVYFISKNKL